MKKHLLTLALACVSFSAAAEWELAGTESYGAKVFVRSESIKKLANGDMVVEFDWTNVGQFQSRSNTLVQVDCKRRMHKYLRITLFDDKNDSGWVVQQSTPTLPFDKQPNTKSAIDAVYGFICKT